MKRQAEDPVEEQEAKRQKQDQSPAVANQISAVLRRMTEGSSNSIGNLITLVEGTS
jgi:hypothetical protein